MHLVARARVWACETMLYLVGLAPMPVSEILDDPGCVTLTEVPVAWCMGPGLVPLVPCRALAAPG